MPTLAGAYNNLKNRMMPQKQGTCGLYSFWFATILLSQCKPTARTIPYPRKSTVTAGTGGESMRHYAKNTLRSGQGEVLTCQEMEDIILHFGFQPLTHLGASGREEFIARSLASNSPVMFPYMMGNSGPISAIPANSNPGVDYGSHWSLIYDEVGQDYIYIEPNIPTTPERQLKKVVLDSNSFVDSYKYDRFWKKDTQSNVTPVKNKVLSTMYGFGVTLGAKVYDIGTADRQNLKNVLIAVS